MIGKKLTPFKFWCQKVLPTVYDDSLSYYEYLGKLNEYLNEVIEQINTLTEAEEDFQEDLSAQWTAYKNGLDTEWLEYKTGLTAEWNTYRTQLTEAWTTTKNYIDNYFDNLNVQNEINNKLDAMVTDGTFTNLITPIVANDIPSLVTTWLNTNVDPVGSAVTVDSSLTISGSAADAKVVGDFRSGEYYIDGLINGQLDDSFIVGNLLNGIKFNDGILIDNTNGNETSNSGYCSTPFIPVDSSSSYRVYSLSGTTKTLLTLTRVVTYDENKAFITGSANINSINNIQSNAKYIKFSVPNSLLDTPCVMYKYNNSTYPDYPVSYKYGIDGRRVNMFKWAIPLEKNGVIINDDGTNLTITVNSRMLTSDNRYTSSLSLTYTQEITSGLFGVALDINTLQLVNRVPHTGHPINSDYYYIGIWWQKRMIFDPRLLIPENRDCYFSLEDNEYAINTTSCNYVFKKVTDNEKNLDTWRFYTMSFPAGSTIFTNVDCEGVLRVQDESDFIGGYHGSERVTAFKVFLDGIDITSQTSYTGKKFKQLRFFVESDVYHCYLNSLAATVAFKRNKIITFEDDKVTIENTWKATSNINLTSARTVLLSVNKWIGFDNYYVNSDNKLYAVNDYSTSHPSDTNKMTESVSIMSSGKQITFRNESVNSDNYLGSVVDLSTRLKYYFDAINTNTYVTINTGDTIVTKAVITVE